MPARAQSPRFGRSAGGRLRTAACFVLMAICVVQAWAIVFVLQIGPVIATIDAQAGRGVHEGDLLALPLVGAALLLFGMGGSSDPALRRAPASRR